MIHAREDYNRIQDPAGLIPNDEPVFLLRGQDIAAPDTINRWAVLASQNGASVEIVGLALAHAHKMRLWQEEHMKKVPDLPTASTKDVVL